MKVKEENEKLGLKLNTHKTKIMASGPITSWQIIGKSMETVRDYFLGLQNYYRWWLQPWIKRQLLLGRKVMTNLDSILKSRNITFPTRVHLVKAMVLPIVMCGCDSWSIKKAEQWRKETSWTVGLEKTPESPLDCKDFKTVHPKGNQSWIFIGLNDAEAETPIPRPYDVKNRLIWKDPDVGKNWRWKEKGMAEVEMVCWHHCLNGHDSE